MGFRKRLTAVIVAAALAALALAPAATASSHNPTGEFAPFGECPLSNVEIEYCVYSQLTGYVDVGTRTIPLSNPITFQGGFLGAGEETQFHGAENTETLSTTAQTVPGGLLGIVAPGWWPQGLQDGFNETINEGFTKVTATIELAASATEIELRTDNMLYQEGTALGLPVKIKLDNPILGSNCYIGSDTEPIQLNLTTGTSGALTGDDGSVFFNGAFTLITFTGFELVDGTFAAPEAEGCGGIAHAYVDPLINSIFGLPAGSGNNSATLEGVLKVAEDEPVRAP
jgi:hypothetical protein